MRTGRPKLYFTASDMRQQLQDMIVGAGLSQKAFAAKHKVRHAHLNGFLRDDGRHGLPPGLFKLFRVQRVIAYKRIY